MNKHALMLTAATVALMAGPAFGATPTINNKLTTAQKTSTAGPIDIGSGGSVVVTLGSPAVTIDSNDAVKLSTAGSLISNKATSKAIGVELISSLAPGTGPGGVALDNHGKIDLTGSGIGKTGILVSAPDGTGDFFNGGITLDTGSSLSLEGDGSTGIEVAQGATLNGAITILGSLTGTPTTANSVKSGQMSGVIIAGDMNGDFSVGSAGRIAVTGQSSVAFNLIGKLTGSFVNNGSITAAGTASPSATKTNPESGSAISIGNSVTDGIYNAGPDSSGSSVKRAVIGAYGPAPALSIAPIGSLTSTLTIGPFTGPGALSTNYDFINRGTITGRALNVDLNGTGVYIGGTASASVSMTDGVFNSGTIQATATSDTSAASVVLAQAFSIDNNATVGTLVNNGDESGQGIITAGISGTGLSEADGLVIGKNGSLASLVNSGEIAASASTTDTTIGGLNAYAIKDLSGTLQSITNSGSITAKATTLDNNAQVTIAADLSHATAGVNFDNTGTVTGDVLLGGYDDKVTVNGTPSKSASITGDIAFNGGTDTLTIGEYSTVTGAVTELGAGTVDVKVGTTSGVGGTLDLKNTAQGLRVSDLNVYDSGTLDVGISQGFNQTNLSTAPAIISATGAIKLDSGSTFGLSFGSFISTPGGTGTAKFVLLDAGAGNLTVGNYAQISTDVQNSKPFLFDVKLCGYNLGVASACSTNSTTAHSQLVLELTPKSATDLGLTGNTKKIFSYANAALANDDVLGAAVITGVTDATTAQDTYAGFLPDLSGSSRAVAVSLTDQATGPVGARQRTLRMYAAQPGGTTMWGQEFVQRLNSGGNAEAYRGSGFGFAIGADSGSAANGRYGGAFTFFSGDQTNKAANFSKITNEWYMLSGYTDWRGKGLFLDTQLNVGYGSLNGKRYLELTNANTKVVTKRKATSKRAGLLLSGGITTGAVFTYGGTVLVPQLSIDALTMRENGYTEFGGGDGFDLKVSPYYAHSVRAYFGTTVRQDIDLGGFYIQPEARIGYRYDVLANPVTLKASFASVGNQFSLTGPDPERGNIVGGLSLAATTGSWSLGVNYDYIRGNGGAVSQNATLTLIGRI